MVGARPDSEQDVQGDARFVRIAGKRQTSGKVVTCKVDEGNAGVDCDVLDDLVE
jgi:hypothetical protein